jgi:hypothetical protein
VRGICGKGRIAGTITNGWLKAATQPVEDEGLPAKKKARRETNPQRARCFQFQFIHYSIST